VRKVAIETVYELAQKDPRVVFIGSDLGRDTLKNFKKEFPERFFMEGVSEATVVGMAAGMALEGKIPYINTISTFLMRRACEQVILDMCLHNVNVRLLGSGGGLVYAPLGPTHLATDDIAIGRAIPNLTVVAPCDADEMKRVMLASVSWPGPMYIRIAKGGDPVVSKSSGGFQIGKAILMKEGKDAIVVTTGITAKIGLDAAEHFARRGVDVGVLHVHTLKPLDTAMVQRAITSVPAVVSIEEHSVLGGLGSAVAEVIAESGLAKRFKRIGIPDVFPEEYGNQASLMKRYSVTTENLIAVLSDLVEGQGR
jgi:transketolase